MGDLTHNNSHQRQAEVNMFNKVILSGYRYHTTSNMWMVNLLKRPNVECARSVEPINDA